jgi:hypothetical protein
MKMTPSLTTIVTMLSLASASQAANVGPSFYGDAPDEHHPWAIHDGNRPQPPVITPGTPSTQEQPGKPPSDAVILFDGSDLSKWEADNDKNEATKWVVKNGAMECVPGSGYIRTKDKFGDIQLHVEWAAPTKVEGDSQGRGNSGVFLMGMLEIQVLDNYNNPTYSDGTAGAAYGIMPPLVNALRPPGQFQNYDIIFRRPIYKDGVALDPGYVTVIENGVVVQDHTMLEGPGGHMARSKIGPFPEVGPLKFQDHGNPVRFRNVWIRPLPKRAVEGATDGYLTTQATDAKRKEIAAMIRQDAEKLKNDANTVPYILRLAESCVYEADEATMNQLKDLSTAYLENLKQLPADKLAARKDEVRHLRDVCNYLVRFKIIESDTPVERDLKQIIADNNWDKKNK